ncbi:MAG TPA: hypothetical protein VIF62_24055 [Labilithrix sp.]
MKLRWLGLALSLVACSSAPQGDSDVSGSGESEDHLLAGRHLSTTEVAQVLRDAGFPENAVGPMICTAKYESSFYERASHRNANGSTDYGLFQINSIHLRDGAGCPSTTEGLYDAASNARCAYHVYRSQGINAWYGYQKHRTECASTRAPAGSADQPLPSDTTSSGGADTSGSGGDDSSDPSDPYAQEDAGSCWSGTLQDMETEGTCVQSKYDGDWYQCHASQWMGGADDSTGPYGACTASYPLN